MTIQTDIHVEYTDTFCGEANYSWLRKAKIEMLPGEDFSDLKAIRLAKKAIGLTGVKCRKENLCDTIALYPIGSCTVCFITFHAHGSCS